MKKEILSEEINAMKYLLGYKRGVVISEQQFGNEKFNFNPNTGAVQGGGINYTPTSTADMLKNAQATVAGATTPATGTPAAQQKFNFNPNPNLNLNPESAIKLQQPTPQELAKAVASAAPATAAPATAAPTPAAPATNLSMPDLIKQIQTILKTKFNATLGNTGPNKDGIDGVWGKNSQTAFENALKTLPAAAAAPTTGTTTVVAGAPAAGTGTPPVSGATSSTQQKFNFNPNPNLNLNPESATNFKLQTPQELAKGLTTATPKLQ
jgi:hypothetical protein